MVTTTWPVVSSKLTIVKRCFSTLFLRQMKAVVASEVHEVDALEDEVVEGSPGRRRS